MSEKQQSLVYEFYLNKMFLSNFKFKNANVLEFNPSQCPSAIHSQLFHLSNLIHPFSVTRNISVLHSNIHSTNITIACEYNHNSTPLVTVVFGG